MPCTGGTYRHHCWHCTGKPRSPCPACMQPTCKSGGAGRACRACGRTCISISCIRLLRRCACCGAACLPPARGAAAAGAAAACGLRPGLKVALHQAKIAQVDICYWSVCACLTHSSAANRITKTVKASGGRSMYTLPDACLPALPAHPPGDGPRVQVALNLVRPLHEAGREGDMNGPLPTACTGG